MLEKKKKKKTFIFGKLVQFPFLKYLAGSFINNEVKQCYKLLFMQDNLYMLHSLTFFKTH